MWPFSNSKKKAGCRLNEVLSETKDFIERSEESIWAGLNPAQITTDLSLAISQIEKNQAVNAEHLSMLFAPTGPIQELAIASGWTDDYMRLSSQFDALIEIRA